MGGAGDRCEQSPVLQATISSADERRGRAAEDELLRSGQDAAFADDRERRTNQRDASTVGTRWDASLDAGRSEAAARDADPPVIRQWRDGHSHAAPATESSAADADVRAFRRELRVPASVVTCRRHRSSPVCSAGASRDCSGRWQVVAIVRIDARNAVSPLGYRFRRREVVAEVETETESAAGADGSRNKVDEIEACDRPEGVAWPIKTSS